MHATTYGLDVAKRVFQVYWVDGDTGEIVNRRFGRDDLIQYANRPVSLRVYADRLAVAAEGQIVCEHVRIIARRHDTAGRTVYDWRHYLAVLQRKPGASRNGAPFIELPEGFRRLQASVIKQPGGDREMVEIWRWCCITTSRPHSPLWSSRSKPACRPRRMCSTCCTGCSTAHLPRRR